jgi:hypothetical protein
VHVTQIPVAFVVARKKPTNEKEKTILKQQLSDAVAQHLGRIARPTIHLVDKLPKTVCFICVIKCFFLKKIFTIFNNVEIWKVITKSNQSNLSWRTCWRC